MNTKTLAAELVASAGYVLHVAHAECVAHPDSAFYAAIRQPDADELTPEVGYGYGATEDEAIKDAFKDWMGAK